MDRRGFLQAIFAAGCAPAFIKAENLMKVFVQPEKDIVIPYQGMILPAILPETGNRLLTIDQITIESLRILEKNLSMTREIIWKA